MEIGVHWHTKIIFGSFYQSRSPRVAKLSKDVNMYPLAVVIQLKARVAGNSSFNRIQVKIEKFGATMHHAWDSVNHLRNTKRKHLKVT